MPNTGTLSGLTPSTEYVLDAVHVDASGNVSAVVSSDPFTTSAVSTPFVERIVSTVGEPTFYYVGTANTFTDTIDVSGRVAGDNLIIVCGPVRNPTGVTVNGNSAGTAVISTSFGTNKQVSVFEYTLQAADITAGSIDVVATLDAIRLDYQMDMFFTSGSIAATASSNHGPDALSNTVTPTQATNAILHIAMGWGDSFDGAEGIVYTDVITTREYNYVGPTYGAAAGIALNVPTSAQTITWTDTETSGPQYAAIAMVVE
jgi:hypothetical protein